MDRGKLLNSSAEWLAEIDSTIMAHSQLRNALAVERLLDSAAPGIDLNHGDCIDCDCWADREILGQPEADDPFCNYHHHNIGGNHHNPDGTYDTYFETVEWESMVADGTILDRLIVHECPVSTAEIRGEQAGRAGPDWSEV